jgi:uncharacterized protein YndB with AHSA1/START domain
VLQFIQTKLGDEPIVVQGYFDSSPSNVFNAWTDPQSVKQWFGSVPKSLHSATIDLQVGGKWRFVEHCNEKSLVGFEGEYITINVNQQLAFTWAKFVQGLSGITETTPASHVDIKFNAKGRGTEVILVHSKIHDDATRKGFGGGWNFAFNTMSQWLSPTSHR